MPRSQRPIEEHCRSVAVSFTPEQYKQVIEYCERNERSLSCVIRKALDKWLEEHKDDHI